MASGRKKTMVLDFLVDDADAQRGLGRLNKSANKTGGAFGKMGKQVKFAMGAVAAGAVVRFGADMAKHAATMEAISRRTDTVFGTSAAVIRDWADDVNESFGLSENGVLNLASSFGDLLVPMGFTRQETANMTIEVLEAANALSEWTGGQVDTATAAEAVSKAMLGEREMLKTLGISILEADVKAKIAETTTEKLTGAALQQAKAIATQALIFEKSADALEAYAGAGDSAIRSQKEVAASVADLKDELAMRLLPFFGQAVVALGDFVAGGKEVVDWFESLPPVVAIAAGAIAGLSVALLALKKHPVIAGMVLITAGITAIGNSSREAKKEFEMLADDLRKFGEIQPETIAETIGKIPEKDLMLMNKLGLSLREVAEWAAGAGLSSRDFKDRLKELNSELSEVVEGELPTFAVLPETKLGILEMINLTVVLGRYQGQIEDVKRELEGQEEATDATAEAMARLKRETYEANRGVGDYALDIAMLEQYLRNTAEGFSAATTETGLWGGSMAMADMQLDMTMNQIQNLAGGFVHLAESTESATEAQKRLVGEQRRAVEPMFAMISAIDEMEEAQDRVVEAEKRVEATQDRVNALQRQGKEDTKKYREALEEQTTAVDLAVEAYGEVIFAQLNLNSASEGFATGKQVALNALTEIGEQAGFAAKEIGKIWSQLSPGGAGTSAPDVMYATGRAPWGDFWSVNRFHSGGVVPGAPGQEVFAKLMAGETVLPTHRGGFSTPSSKPAVQVVVEGSIIGVSGAQELAEIVGREVARKRAAGAVI
jgi:vacuolar-type H+-ATPase subunit D/Vma8